MKRETKKFNTPDGKEVEIRTFLNDRERNQLKSIFAADVKYNAKMEQINSEISGETMLKAQDELIKLAVVSFDGSAENIFERILDGVGNYDAILEEANKIQTGNLPQAK
ncbi:MAG: hypothetical protein PHY48_16300 [Candidatus Cloacimonetes bacterium]|nr:hypothetical protein [Candidatus Cloacimonadota bacterium]